MNKIIKASLSIAAVSAVVLSMAGCAMHEHKWEWKRSETEHWQECECGEERLREAHTDDAEYVCEYCAEFKALSLGFDKGGDTAHSDFAQEANRWFPKMGKEYGFIYDFSTDLGKLNEENLANYDLVIFLNNRPFDIDQQEAFKNYMENGGAWLGFHACAFCMDSDNPHWAWYQDDFLGCGDYKNNTWNPTAETLHIETHDHCSTANFGGNTFVSTPNEWYGWMSDLTVNDDIIVLLTLDESTFPVGDNPHKDWEIWKDYIYTPVAWTNKNYKMVYMNWGHNLQPYNDFEKESETFSSEGTCQFVLDAMFGLTKR